MIKDDHPMKPITLAIRIDPTTEAKERAGGRGNPEYMPAFMAHTRLYWRAKVDGGLLSYLSITCLRKSSI